MIFPTGMIGFVRLDRGERSIPGRPDHISPHHGS